MIGIEQFKDVLDAVEHQVFSGKGFKRHGNGTPLDEQPWYTISKNVGAGFCLGQAMKKIMELRNIEDHSQWEKEIFGAMAYLVFSVLYRREQSLKTTKDVTSDPVPFESLKNTVAIPSKISNEENARQRRITLAKEFAEEIEGWSSKKLRNSFAQPEAVRKAEKREEESSFVPKE